MGSIRRQYTAEFKREEAALVTRQGCAMTATVVERVFRSLKEECAPEQPPETHRQARLLVRDYLEMFDKSQRLHSMLGYQSPNDFGAQAAEGEAGVLRYGPRG